MYSQLRASSSTISAQDYQLKYPLLEGLYNALITGRNLSDMLLPEVRISTHDIMVIVVIASR